MDKELRKLLYEATDRCFRSPMGERQTIMKDMIEKAYAQGIETGRAEQKQESRMQIAHLMIP